MTRILVIDDDAFVRRSLARTLLAAGYEVVTAENGKMAVKCLSEQEMDLVITDINMPDMDGLEVIMKMSGGSASIPVIAMSGGGLMPKEMLLDSAGLLGARATIEKPFTPGEILPLIEAALSADA